MSKKAQNTQPETDPAQAVPQDESLARPVGESAESAPVADHASDGAAEFDGIDLQDGRVADGAAPSASREKGSDASPRRASGAPRGHVMHYVNRMRNVGKVAGFVVDAGKSHFVLQQNNNIEHALRVEVNTKNPKYADPRRLIGKAFSVKLHIRGYRNEDGPQVSIHCIELDNPSIFDLPLEKVWAAGYGGLDAAKNLRKMGDKGFTPFDEMGNLKPEYAQYLRNVSDSGDFEIDPSARDFIESMRVIDDVINISGGVVSSRSRAGQNYFSVAGCIDACVMIPANEFRPAYGLIMLRQHENQEFNIPVRVTGTMAAAYIGKLPRGYPALVEGSLRRKVIPDAEGNIVSRHVYIETKKISPATSGDILNGLPDWWKGIPEHTRKERERRRLEAEERKRRVEAERAGAQDDDVVTTGRAAPPELDVDL
jgi:hypothetical protein